MNKHVRINKKKERPHEVKKEWKSLRDKEKHNSYKKETDNERQTKKKELMKKTIRK